MAENIDLNKSVFNKRDYNKTIDTSFTQLGVKSIQQQLDDQPTVQEFFSMYNTLFYQIPAEGNVNSHISLIQRSSEYIGFTEENDENVQILLDEITSLREELLQTQKELRDTELNALSENNEVTTGVEDEDVQNEPGITAGTQFTAQSTVVGSTSGGSSGGSY